MYGFLLVYDWFVLTRTEWGVLILATALVLAAEALNTAVEALVDLVSPEKHPLAAKSKDAAAGAVLLCSVGAVAAGIAILLQPAAFHALYQYYALKPLMLVPLGLSGIAAGLFVFADWKRKGH